MSFTVYKSSAGSGKTYTLVKEYLKIALSSDYPDKYRGILAITFTNKAAAEMKDRILHALKQISETDSYDLPLLTDITNELNISKNDICIRARNTLEHILHHYSDFAVLTIDKFVHRIIRAFATDLKLPHNFEVELDTDELLYHSVNTVINKTGENELLTKFIIEFAEKKADSNKSWHIENDLIAFAKNLFSEDSYTHLENLKKYSLNDFDRITSQLYKQINLFETTISKFGSEGLKIISEAGIDESAFAGGKNGLPKYFSYLKNVNSAKLIPTQTIASNMKQDKWHATKAGKEDVENINSVKGTLADIYNKATKYIDENYQSYFFKKLIVKNIYSLAVLNEIEKALEQLKISGNFIHISEFNKCITDIVVNEPAPFIYERIGERYKNYLIDEFQDTSLLQWQNLIPLFDNSLSSGNFNMIVGDGKQAIYRWRNGDVEQFANLPDIKNSNENFLLKEREETLVRNYSEKILNSNWRSKAEIVEFNNTFFTEISKQLTDEYKPIYNSVIQKYNSNNTGGYVSVEVLPEKKTVIQNDVEITIGLKDSTAEKVLQIINNNISVKKYSPQDICILCRTNNEASFLASYLISKNVKVVSSESLLLTSSPKVNFLISFFRHLSSPYETAYRAEMIIFLSSYIENSKHLHRHLSRLSEPGEEVFSQILSELGFNMNKYDITGNTLYETTEYVIKECFPDYKTDVYLNFFLNYVHEFSVKQNSISEFLLSWENSKKKLSVVIPEMKDAVKIMTIHKSKGLEFPVVIFPFANWKIETKTKYIWADVNDAVSEELKSVIVTPSAEMELAGLEDVYSKEKSKSLLDDMNLLYVAFTRPREKLFVITSESRPYRNLSSSIITVLENMSGWNKEKLLYVSGVDSSFSGKEEKGNNLTELLKLHSTDWRNKIQISWSNNYNEEFSSDNMFRKKFGTLIHKILAEASTYTAAEHSALQLTENGQLSHNELNLIKDELKKVFSMPLLNELLKDAAEVKNESDILLVSGDSIRPDKVLFAKNKVVLIDFKTGIKSNKHNRQINNYSEILSEMGYENIEKYLVYTSIPEIIKA